MQPCQISGTFAVLIMTGLMLKQGKNVFRRNISAIKLHRWPKLVFFEKPKEIRTDVAGQQFILRDEFGGSEIVQGLN